VRILRFANIVSHLRFSAEIGQCYHAKTTLVARQDETKLVLYRGTDQPKHDTHCNSGIWTSTGCFFLGLPHPWIIFTKFETSSTYPFLTHNVITAELRHAAILTGDPLTLNVCSVSAVTRSNSVPNLIAIEQSAADLRRFKQRKFRLTGSGFSQFRGVRIGPACQVSLLEPKRA